MEIPPVLRVIALLATLSGAAAADIIVWRDNSGVSHYTNDISNVPSEYRGEAMTVAKEWSRTPPRKGRAPAVAAAATSADADVGAATTSRNAYEAAYVSGFRAGAQGDTASGAGEDQDDGPENSSTAGASHPSPVPDVVEGHRPRKTDLGGSRDSRARDSLQSADSEP
jgi:hypothetical protein